MRIQPDIQTFVKIKVIGVGGGGSNAVSRMADSKIKGVEFVAVNTDAQDLHFASVKQKIHIGKNITKGLGAGMNPEIGKAAAEESRSEILELLKGADMVFITSGLGGGTGTGASPIIAEIAKELGILSIAIITKPFTFEGSQRSQIAESGLASLKDKVDALIVIPNDKILNIIDKQTLLLSAFEKIDNILHQAVQGISDLITYPGIINVDFADIKAIMKDAGPALMGIGQASGKDRAIEAAKAAITSPLLDIALDGAKKVLFSVSGSSDLTMTEINEAAKIITESVDKDAKIIFGAFNDPRVKKNEIKITIIATGFDENQKNLKLPFEESRQNIASSSIKDQPRAGGQVKDFQNKKSFQESEIESLKKQNEWDIPAFLRKKKEEENQ